ncbi:MAG TPA: pitrilysin family protein [Verrucomicrobiae bacterium]|nr:pitrilysin family protein [Verrucomicrobiae bacterium]
MKHQVSRLKNGMTVATVEMPHMASVSLGIWVGVGGRYEPAELNGVSHFIEHMLFKGTRRRSAKEISQSVEGIGGYLNAFTGEESTCFYSKARHDRYDQLMDVLTDMFLNSKFDPTEIAKERGVIKEELAMYMDQPHQLVQELLNETLWPNHPLGRALTGTEKTIDAIDRAKLLSYRRANYVAPTTLVTAAGNLSHDKIVRAVSKFAGKFATGKRPGFQPVQDTQSEPRMRAHTKDTAQLQLALGFRTCSRHDERRFALRILNTLLGENMSSRLFQVIREDHGLAYSVHSCLVFFDDVGSLIISAGMDTDQIPRVMKLIMAEVKRFTEKAPSAEEMRRTRDFLLGQIDLSLESTENQMMWLGDQLIGYGKIIAPTEIKKRLTRVQPSEVRRVAQAFFRPERLSAAVVSPLKNSAFLRRLARM